MAATAPGPQDLYRQIVLDHSRNPRNQRRPGHYDREAEGHNALCGDKVRVYLTIRGSTIGDVAFEATGCAICLASASLMTEATQGRDAATARTAIGQFEAALTRGQGQLTGDLAALGGVSQYPSRIRCAMLPWMTLLAALDASTDTVSTESVKPSR
jgi:nitrogen fixation NifU-like protein